MSEDSNRSQLTSLKAELERVELDLRFLRVKAEQLESRITEQENVASQSAVIEPLVAKTATPPPEKALSSNPFPQNPHPPPPCQPPWTRRHFHSLWKLHLSSFPNRFSKP